MRTVSTTRISLGLSLVLGIGLASLARAADAPPATRESEPAQSDWSETINGVRVRLLAPRGTTCRDGALLPLRVEVQNHGEQVVASRDLWSTVRVLAHDGDGHWIGIPSMGPQIGDWATRTGSLEPGQSSELHFALQSLRFNRAVKAGETIQLQVSAPTQRQRAGKLPLEANSPALPIRIDGHFPQPLAEADVSEEWHLDLACQLEIGLMGSQTLHVDAQGRATLIQNMQRNGQRLNRRLAETLPANRLRELAAAMRKLELWKLSEVSSAIAGPDEASMQIAIVSPTGGSVAGVYPWRLESQTPRLRELHQVVERLIADVEALAGK